jgi:hypothetical protein
MARAEGHGLEYTYVPVRFIIFMHLIGVTLNPARALSGQMAKLRKVRG